MIHENRIKRFNWNKRNNEKKTLSGNCTHTLRLLNFDGIRKFSFNQTDKASTLLDVLTRTEYTQQMPSCAYRHAAARDRNQNKFTNKHTGRRWDVVSVAHWRCWRKPNAKQTHVDAEHVHVLHCGRCAEWATHGYDSRADVTDSTLLHDFEAAVGM